MSCEEKIRLAGDRLNLELRQACDGLSFISETDAPIVPVEAFVGSSVKDFVEESAGGERVKVFPVGSFFDRPTTEQEWHTDADRERVRRFRRLRKIILDNLDDVMTYRAGKIRVEIFVLGTDREGKLAGIRTRSVET